MRLRATRALAPPRQAAHRTGGALTRAFLPSALPQQPARRMTRRAAAPALALLLLLAAAARGAALGDNDAAAAGDAEPESVLFPAGARTGRCVRRFCGLRCGALHCVAR